MEKLLNLYEKEGVGEQEWEDFVLKAMGEVFERGLLEERFHLLGGGCEDTLAE